MCLHIETSAAGLLAWPGLGQQEVGKNICLVIITHIYVFTYRDFSGGTLGLAWVGSAGGMRKHNKSFSKLALNLTVTIVINTMILRVDICLAYVFTYRDFSGGTLGLAWVGSAGGMKIYHFSLQKIVCKRV